MQPRFQLLSRPEIYHYRKGVAQTIRKFHSNACLFLGIIKGQARVLSNDLNVIPFQPQNVCDFIETGESVSVDERSYRLADFEVIGLRTT
jgi:hypothetical protein